MQRESEYVQTSCLIYFYSFGTLVQNSGRDMVGNSTYFQRSVRRDINGGFIFSSKRVLKPVWTCGIELWGCATKSNIAVMQRYQSRLLRSMTNAPWYVSNHTLHFDLRIPYVYMVFRERTATHRTTLESQPNSLMEPLVHPPNNRRLKRRWTTSNLLYAISLNKT